MNHPVLLYDGVCGLCNRSVQFVVRRDAAGVFRFAALQSEFAIRALARHGVRSSDLDAAYVLLGCEAEKHEAGNCESLLARSDAVLFVLRELGGLWGWVARILQWLPRTLRDLGYRWVARRRYQIFGRYDSCLLPNEAVRGRFLD